MVEFADALFEKVRAGHAVLVAGVRFAETAGAPGWDQVLGSLTEKLSGDDAKAVKRLVSDGQLLTAAGYLRRKLGQESFAESVVDLFSAVEDPGTAHTALADVPFKAFISTGYDLLAKAAFGSDAVKTYRHSDGAVLRVTEELDHFVLSAHGDIEDPDHLVFSQRDYKRLIATNQPYRSFVEDLFRADTWVLAGYQPNDPDFVLLLERLAAGFRDGLTDHYALMSGVSAPLAEELYANYRLRVIDVEEGADALGDAISAFAKQWQESGGKADVDDPVGWLTSQLGPVDVRIDILAGEGLTLSDARLRRIAETAGHVKLSQLNPDTLNRLGNVRLYLSDAPGAIECYEAALAQDDALAAAHLNLHHAKAEARDYGKSLEHLKKATELDKKIRVLPERFDVKAVIGRGTTGTVYDAQDSEGDKHVTVKVLRNSYVREHLSPELWLKETQALTTLDHKNIAKVYDAIVADGRCILVTESMSGRSLDRRIRDDGAVGADEAAKVFTEVCEALTYAHEQGIYHLDIAPSNVFLRDDGTVALMDFRSGRAERGRTVSIKPGSEGFQAPELLSGSGADQRADVYSLGASLYYALTKQLPMGSFARLGEVAQGAKRFERLVHRSLRAVREERPASAEEFAKGLQAGAETVAEPENADDLVGWLEVLAYDPDHENAAAAVSRLEAQYREEKDWDSVITLLLGRLDVAGDPALRLELFREVARVFELEVGDLSKAFAALSAGVREHHTNLEMQKDLERLAGATGMWNDLLQEYNTIAQEQREPKVACDWWVRIGQLYSHEVGHDDYAVAAFNHALSLDANRGDALRELTDVLKRKGDWKEFTRVMERQVNLEDVPASRVEMLRDLGRVYAKQLNSPEQAILSFRKGLEIDATDQGLTRELASIYQTNEMWDELVALVKNSIEASDDATALIKYRHMLADVLSDQLSRPEEAIEQLQEIRKLDAEDAKALKDLERLYDAAGRNEEYLEILNERIAAAKTDGEKIALFRRLANEWEAQPGGLRRAAEYREMVADAGGANPETFRALVKIYGELKDADRLADAYARLIDISERPEVKANLSIELAGVYEKQLEEPKKAISTLENLLGLDPENAQAMMALGSLYQGQKAYQRAVDMFSEVAQESSPAEMRATALYHLGLIRFDHLNELDEAEVHLVQARELDGKHLDTLVALSRLYRKRKDFGKAARVLTEAAEVTPNDLERVRRLHLAADLWHREIGDEDRAIEAYKAVLEVDPEHIESADALASIYENREEWELVQPLVQMLLRKADKADKKRVASIYLRFGQVALKTGDKEKAAGAFRGAYQLDTSSIEAAKQLAALLFERKEHEEAAKLFQQLLIQGADSLPTADVGIAYLRLAEIKQIQGEDKKSKAFLDKAVEAAPDEPPVLMEAVSAYEERGDHEAAAKAKTHLVELLEGEEKLKALVDIGEALLRKVNKPAEAIECFDQALEIDPDFRLALYLKMDAHIAMKQWDSAIEIIKRMEKQETDASHSYRLHYTAAVIYRDQLKDPEAAAEHFDLALQSDPTNMKAFKSLRSLYTKQEKWDKLWRAYRLMLKRLPESTPIQEQVELYSEAGLLAKEKLRDAKKAIIQFEMVAKLDPNNAGHEDQLARLYVSAGADAYDKAIHFNQRLIERNPFAGKAYLELRKIYSAQNELDKAYCVAAVLAVLDKKGEFTTDEERDIYEDYRRLGLQEAQSKLTDAVWRECLLHPLQSKVLTEAYAQVGRTFAPWAARAKDELRIKQDNRLRPDDDSRIYAKAYDYVTRVISEQPKELYLRRGLKAPLEPQMYTDEATNGSGATLLYVDPKVLELDFREVVFSFARSIAFMKPEHMLCYAAPTTNVLQAVALACLKVAQPNSVIKGDAAKITQISEGLSQKLAPQQIDRLTKQAEALRGIASQEIEIFNWLKGVEFTADRAGLLLCDDLETAASLVGSTGALSVEVKPKERLAQLFAFAASEPYFEARSRLGLQVREE